MQSAPGSGDQDGEEEGAIFAEINITPLTDVFLVLLIIFMLVASSMVEVERNNTAATAKALAEKAMQVQTPKGSGDSEVVAKDIVVSILPDGTLYVDDAKTEMNMLPTALLTLKSQAAAARVVIRGDQKAEYQLIMEVISAARSIGITDVALASRSK